MKKIALVTGANQGLGLALVRRLSRQWGEQGIVYLGARHQARGEEAVALLQAEGFSPHLAVIDVSNDASVQNCADLIGQRHLPTHLHHHFGETTMSLSDVESVMDSYARAVQTGTAQQEGWPE